MNDNNEAKILKKQIKKDFNKLGLAILMKELIAIVVVILCVAIILIMEILKNPNLNEIDFKGISDNGTYMGVISIIAAVISIIPLLVYRGRKFFQYDLKVENKKFTWKTVAVSIVILLSLNSALVLFSNVLELALNSLGLSAIAAMEALEYLNKFTIPTIIYSCLVAPVVEEFIFRGAILRGLEKYGKWFAILISGILFGLMHGNFFQIFMGMGVGVILGYLATEYSIKLTILLHIINNISVEVLSQVSSHVSEWTDSIISMGFISASIIILVVALVREKNSISEWLRENKMQKGIVIKFFTSILVILTVAYYLFNVISNIRKIS